MRTKRVFLLGLLSTVLIAGLIGGLALALKHEPTFYRYSDLAATPQRKELSTTFMNSFGQLSIDLKDDGKQWRHTFTEAQLNSFFLEDFVRLGEAENLRRLGLSDPRVLLEDNKLRIAFRYGTGLWSAVVSYDLKLWLVPHEQNMIAVEILSRRVGALPLSSQSLLNELSELARRHGIEMTLYREQRHPVAILRFQADRPRPTTHLCCLRLDPASLTLAGGAPPQAQSPAPEKKGPLTPSAN